jgi:hypothetical protein
MSGEIPDGGMLDVLREIEARRISGRLRFSTGGQTGDVAIIAGQIALDQEPMEGGADPVEVMLKARKGHYVVHQRLPTLPVSQGDDDHRVGSLQVHVPADLMNYCEQSGVTGTLRLLREGKQAELVYDAGELLAIRLDGKEDADLSAVFAWDEGSFDIAVGKDVKALVPTSMRPSERDDPSEREPTTQFVRPRTDDTGKHFLKVFEVALTDVVETRERVRPKTHTSPPRAPAPSIRPPAAMPKIAPPARRPREHTVRIAYLAGDDESAIAAINQVARQAAGVRSPDAMSMVTSHDEPSSGEEALPPEKKPAPTARDDERAEPEEEADDEREDRSEEEEEPAAPAQRKVPAPAAAPPATAPAPGAFDQAAWAVVAIATGIATYYLLSYLLTAS